MNVRLKEDYLKMRFSDIYNRYSAKELDTQAAADILDQRAYVFKETASI